MARLPVTIATWDHGSRAGAGRRASCLEGCDADFITMPVEECLERAYFHGEFEVA